ncbi:hypothetical protein FSP39_001699 [Pinctada imbricata]|uniref:Uncharacterized protein n=1 Tax=Pinctada imbricata TaxID=66713 RepID=A0AA89CAH3_PINIB|nr:hypothetical protein FSP39_001699 [Pinctada imbricata]
MYCNIYSRYDSNQDTTFLARWDEKVWRANAIPSLSSSYLDIRYEDKLSRHPKKFAFVLFDHDGLTFLVETKRLQQVQGHGTANYSVGQQFLLDFDGKPCLVEILALSDSLTVLDQFEETWESCDRAFSITLLQASRSEETGRRRKHGGYLQVKGNQDQVDSVVVTADVHEPPADDNQRRNETNTEARDSTGNKHSDSNEDQRGNGNTVTVLFEGAAEENPVMATPHRQPGYTGDMSQDEQDLVTATMTEWGNNKRSTGTMTDPVITLSSVEELDRKTVEISQDQFKQLLSNQEALQKQVSEILKVMRSEIRQPPATQPIPETVVAATPTTAESDEATPARNKSTTEEEASSTAGQDDLPTLIRPTRRETTDPSQVVEGSSTFEENESHNQSVLATPSINGRLSVEGAAETPGFLMDVEPLSPVNDREESPITCIAGDPVHVSFEGSTPAVVQDLYVVNVTTCETPATRTDEASPVITIETPATRTDDTPATRTDGTPATRTDDTPATRTDGTPATRTDDTPATRTDCTPATRTDDTPATRTDGTPATRTDGTPATRTDDTPATRTDDTPPIIPDETLATRTMPKTTNKVLQKLTQYSPQKLIREVNKKTDIVKGPYEFHIARKKICETNQDANNAGNFLWHLTKEFYEDRELVGKNFMGRKGREGLSPRRRKAVSRAYVEIYGSATDSFSKAINAVNNGIRALKFKQKKLF